MNVYIVDYPMFITSRISQAYHCITHSALNITSKLADASSSSITHFVTIVTRVLLRKIKIYCLQILTLLLARMKNACVALESVFIIRWRHLEFSWRIEIKESSSPGKWSLRVLWCYLLISRATARWDRRVFATEILNLVRRLINRSSLYIYV